MNMVIRRTRPEEQIERLEENAQHLRLRTTHVISTHTNSHADFRCTCRPSLSSPRFWNCLQLWHGLQHEEGDGKDYACLGSWKQISSMGKPVDCLSESLRSSKIQGPICEGSRLNV